MTEAEFQRRLANAFFGTMHKLNAEHVSGQTADAVAASVLSTEARHLISILRDETQSKSTYDRCVAIVGPS